MLEVALTSGDKVLVVESSIRALSEDVEVLGERDDHTPEECKVRAPDTQRCLVSQS